jgi:hypothetical protein
MMEKRPPANEKQMNHPLMCRREWLPERNIRSWKVFPFSGEESDLKNLAYAEIASRSSFDGFSFWLAFGQPYPVSRFMNPTKLGSMHENRNMAIAPLWTCSRLLGFLIQPSSSFLLLNKENRSAL